MQMYSYNNTFIGIPCQDMAPLHHGNATCLTGVTDDTCSFQCSKGFSLKGSKQRTCGIEHKWNGTITSCNRKLKHPTNFQCFRNEQI